MKKAIAVLFVPAAVMAAQCCVGQSYAVVTVSYQYDESDQSTRQWRAFLNALDKCHNAGYQDAAPAAPAATVCETVAQNGCTRFRATISYDCYGLGYQTSS
jgi:hypothetical protein